MLRTDKIILNTNNIDDNYSVNISLDTNNNLVLCDGLGNSTTIAILGSEIDTLQTDTVVYTNVVNVTPNQIRTKYVELVAAPAANIAIKVLSVDAKYKFVSSGYTLSGSTNVYLSYSGSTGATSAFFTTTNTLSGLSNYYIYSNNTPIGSNVNNITGLPIGLTFAASSITNGDGIFKFVTTYVLVDLS